MLVERLDVKLFTGIDTKTAYFTLCFLVSGENKYIYFSVSNINFEHWPRTDIEYLHNFNVTLLRYIQLFMAPDLCSHSLL